LTITWKNPLFYMKCIGRPIVYVNLTYAKNVDCYNCFRFEWTTSLTMVSLRKLTIVRLPTKCPLLRPSLA